VRPRARARAKNLFKTLRVSNSNSNYYDNTDERYTTSDDLTSTARCACLATSRPCAMEQPCAPDKSTTSGPRNHHDNPDRPAVTNYTTRHQSRIQRDAVASRDRALATHGRRNRTRRQERTPEPAPPFRAAKARNQPGAASPLRARCGSLDGAVGSLRFANSRVRRPRGPMTSSGGRRDPPTVCECIGRVAQPTRSGRASLAQCARRRSAPAIRPPFSSFVGKSSPTCG